jgi:hypothetical protein
LRVRGLIYGTRGKLDASVEATRSVGHDGLVQALDAQFDALIFHFIVGTNILCDCSDTSYE